MALKKNVRTNGVYLISTDKTDNPKLLGRVLDNGKESLLLQYYFGSETKVDKDGTLKRVQKRKMEKLGLTLLTNPKTPLERETNKQTLELAKKIRFERAQELLQGKEGYRLKPRGKEGVFSYFETYLEQWITERDPRMIRLAFNRFKDFWMETQGKFEPTFKQLTPDVIKAFTLYLQKHSKGEGAVSIYQRFKKVIKHAVDHEIITKNPCTDITIKADTNTIKKDVLSLEEIQALINTHYQFESQNIRNAFLLCLCCGLRFCDVSTLTYANVDYSNGILKYDQNKTSGHSSNSMVAMQVNDFVLQLIGTMPEGAKREDSLFNLPSYEACEKALKRWCKYANIDKHITWHCARHSCATNMMSNGTDIKTTQSILGHSDLKYTLRYVRAVDKLKRNAIDGITNLKL